MELHGDKLETTPQRTKPEELKGREVYQSITRDNYGMRSNISGGPKTVLYCRGLPYGGCGTDSRRISLPAYGSVDVPLEPEDSGLGLIVTKPKEVIVECMRGVRGTTSTFVNSRITFGAPVSEKGKKENPQ
jgi:hypothetical protein